MRRSAVQDRSGAPRRPAGAELRPQPDRSLFTQGRWYCSPCQVLCSGTLPLGESPIHHCGQVMHRVASIWETEA